MERAKNTSITIDNYTCSRVITVTEGETKRVDVTLGTMYLKNGKLHNTNGPAIIRDGVFFFYVEGCDMSFKEWLTYCTLSDIDKAMMLFTME
jgi:hypothetical protein